MLDEGRTTEDAAGGAACDCEGPCSFRPPDPAVRDPCLRLGDAVAKACRLSARRSWGTVACWAKSAADCWWLAGAWWATTAASDDGPPADTGDR